MKELPGPRAGVWIDVVGIEDADIALLTERHGIDDGLLKDAQDFFEAPRVEYEQGVAYFFTRFPTKALDDTTTAPLLIIIGDDYVLTAVGEKPEWLDRIMLNAHTYSTQKAKLFLQILGGLEREYNIIFTALRREVRRARLNVSDVTEKAIEQSVEIEYAINELVSALVPTNAALQSITAGKHLKFFEEDLELLEDVRLANSQLIEGAKNTLKTIQNIRAAHTTLVSNRLNRVVRTLTALTIILTIPTIVGTFYGMNVSVPLGESPHAFTFIAAITITIVSLAIYLFRKNRWL